jgi:hypothetical protein
MLVAILIVLLIVIIGGLVAVVIVNQPKATPQPSPYPAPGYPPQPTPQPSPQPSPNTICEPGLVKSAINPCGYEPNVPTAPTGPVVSPPTGPEKPVKEVSRDEVTELLVAYRWGQGDTCVADGANWEDRYCADIDKTEWTRIGWILKWGGRGRKEIFRADSWNPPDICVGTMDFIPCHGAPRGPSLGYVMEKPTPDTVPLFRSYNSRMLDTCPVTVYQGKMLPQCHDNGVGDNDEPLGYVYPPDYFDDSEWTINEGIEREGTWFQKY